MRRHLALGLLILLAFALRIHLLGNQELRGDEAFSWNYIQNPPHEIVATIIREGDPQPPLHYWLQWVWGVLTGYSEFAMRAWSAFLSVLLVPLMYQIGRKFFNRPVALLAAGITAIHPQQIWLAQDVRNMYQLALVFLLTATLLLHHLKTHAEKTSSQRWLWAGYIACGVVAMYSHYYSLFFLIAHGAYLGLNRDSQTLRLYRNWAIAGIAIAAIVAPWAVVILPVYAGGQQLNDPGSLSIIDYTTSAFGDLLAGPVYDESLKTIIAISLGLIAIASLIYFFSVQSSRSLALYLLAAIVVPFIGIYVITSTRATFNTFYFVFAFPAVYLLIAAGLRIAQALVRPIGLVLTAALIIAYAIGLRNHYTDPAFSKTRGMRELTQYIALNAQPGDIYLANSPDPAQVYYVKQTGLVFHMQPGTFNPDPAQLDAELNKLLAHRIWFVPTRTAQDPNGIVEEHLRRMGIIAEEFTKNRMHALLVIPLTEATPINAQFANGIRLAGYYLAPNRLTLLWATDSPLADDYTIFVHALADDGFNLTSHDAQPTPPTSQWQLGEIIINVHDFEIPTDQTVHLVTGLYFTPDSRLPLETKPSLEENTTLVTTISP